MLRLVAVTLGIVALGVMIGALVAYSIPPASLSHTASSWGDNIGNRHGAAASNSAGQAVLEYDSAPPPLPPAQPAEQANAGYAPYGPDDRDRVDARDEPPAAPGYTVGGGDAPDPDEDRAAQAADAARDAADEARAAGAAPPVTRPDDR
jgi:hypothetical protein